MSGKFTFDGALMHFARVKGPGGFIWKYAVAYGLATVLLFGVMILAVGGPFLRLMELSAASSTGQIDEEAAAAAMMSLIPLCLLAIPLGIGFWAVFESAVQRRYVRQEGFSLKFGGDEGRLLVIGLLWILTIFVLYLGVAIVAGVLIGAAGLALGEAAALIAIPVVIAAICAFLWVLVRLSPASAMTIRDRQIVFPSAFSASKGRFWPMFGAFVVIALVAIVVSLITQVLMGGVMGGALAANPAALESGDIGAMFTNPVLLIGILLATFVSYALNAVVQFAFAGIAAKAALTDPNWEGAVQIDETFS